MKITTCGYAAQSAKEPLAPWKFETKALEKTDVHVDIQYCGICHSDVHQCRDDWGFGGFPKVAGHEIVGLVKQIGPEVKKFKVGDCVGVGCFVDCCRKCKYCKRGDDNVCSKAIYTFNMMRPDGTMTQGGFARDIVVEERFVYRIPSSLDPAEAAPLLCAGVTTYGPMKIHGADKPGTKIAVIGLGGLGHMAVKFAVAWGNEVTVISRTEAKKKEALEVLGATHYIASSNQMQLEAAAESFDIIVDTVSAEKPMDPYINLLAVDGTLISVGIPPGAAKIAVSPFPMIVKRRKIAGGCAAGSKVTQEMLDFCGEKKLGCLIEKIPMDKINEAFERVEKADVRYRFVLEVAKTCPMP